MNWEDLRYLLALHRTGSMSGAGRLLHVDQTTVGRRIDALEHALGTLLVERNTNGCRLSSDGRQALEVAERMEVAAQGLEAGLLGRSRGVHGLVRIATAEGFVPVLAVALADLQRLHPDLQFELVTSTDLLNLVRREADIAVRMTGDSQPSLVASKAGEITWGLFATEGYVARYGMPHGRLAGHVVIGFDEVMSRTPGGRWLMETAPDARVAVRVNNLLSAVACAGADMGLVACPHFIAARDPRLREVWPELLGIRPVWLVTHQDLTRVPRVRATLDYLVPYIRQQGEKLLARRLGGVAPIGPAASRSRKAPGPGSPKGKRR